jgi:hypothetical protein
MISFVLPPKTTFPPSTRQQPGADTLSFQQALDKKPFPLPRQQPGADTFQQALDKKIATAIADHQDIDEEDDPAAQRDLGSKVGIAIQQFRKDLIGISRVECKMMEQDAWISYSRRRMHGFLIVGMRNLIARKFLIKAIV